MECEEPLMPPESRFSQFVLPSKKTMLAARLQVVVVLEDDHRWICEALQSFGFLVQAFCQGEDALEYVAETRTIAGILLDVHARDRGGASVLAQFKTSYPQMPIIVMADSKNIDLLRKAIDQGAHEYLVLPTDPQLLKIKCAHVFFHRGLAGLANNIDGQSERIEPDRTR